MAILGVLAFHAAPQALPGGFAGVDVFFVISGYVVSQSLLARGTAAPGSGVAAFYARRVRRLFPALLCLLLVVAIVGFCILPTAQLALLGKHIVGSAGFAQNLLLWGEAGYFDAASHEKWLLHLWSLGIEEQFYLLLPLLFLAARLPGLQARAHRAIWPGMLIALALASLSYSLWQSRQAPSAGFYLPMGRFWEFLLGVLLAVWPLRARRAGPILATLAFIALCLSFLCLDESRRPAGAQATDRDPVSKAIGAGDPGR